MQTASMNDPAAMGFAGLRGLSVPVDDLLSDVAGAKAFEDAFDVESLSANRRRYDHTRKRRRATGRFVVAGLVLTAVAAVYLWQGGTATNSGPVNQTSVASGVDIATLVQPAIGRDQILTRAEIRYCLAESMRLQAARDQAASVVVDVARLNASVQDLNARCGDYQYRGDDLALAQADVDLRSAEFIASGQREFVVESDLTDSMASAGREDGARATEQKPVAALDGVGSDTAVEPAAQSGESPKLIKDAQWILFKLGYYDGPMSGELSESTVSARGAFLAEQGLDDALGMREMLPYLRAEQDRRVDSVVVVNKADTVSDEAAVPETAEASESEAGTLSGSGSAALPDLSGLADVDRLAIENLCRATFAGRGYAGCLATQQARLAAAPKVSLTALSDAQRRDLLSECGPKRDLHGPAAYHRCLADSISQVVQAPVVNSVVAAAASSLPQNVVSAIENRCANSAAQGAGELARCFGGQFANLASPMEALYLSELEFTERSAIERVCATVAGVGDVNQFYACSRSEVQALREVGGKPDMKIASFEDRKNIESACQSARLSQGPALYYECLNVELSARGY